jgi:phage baseplate assembly protein W
MAIIFFKDLPLDFTPHPVTGDIRPITNDIAIKRSIMNIIMTEPGEKPFRPRYGSNIKNFLFSNQDEFATFEISKQVEEAITNNEARVDLVQVTTTFVDSGIQLNIKYRIKNIGVVGSLITTVSRTA